MYLNAFSHSLNFIMGVRPLVYLFLLLLAVCGDVHPNPGPVDHAQAGITLCHVNTRSILTPGRLEEFYLDLCCLHHFDIIGVSESHLSDQIPDSDVAVPNYNTFRRDRNRGGGGVMIYVHERFSCSRRPDLESPDLEILWAEIKLNGFTLIVGVCYRQPNQKADVNDLFIDSLENTLSSIHVKGNQVIALLGDFNDRCQIWDSDHKDSELGLKLYRLVQSLNFSQLITKPTRRNNILDLLITDSPNYFMNVDVMPSFDNLDHSIIHGMLNLHPPKTKLFKRKIILYDRGDYQLLNDLLFSVDWDHFFSHFDDLDTLTNSLTELLLEFIERCVPVKQVTIRSRDKPGMTHEVRKLFKTAKKLHKRAKRTGNLTDLEHFRNARRLAKTSFRKAKSKFYQDISEKLTNPATCNKTYWKLNKLVYGAKSSSKIPDLKDADSDVTKNEDKAALFNRFFAEQCSLASGLDDDQLPDFHLLTDSSLDSITTTPAEVHKILRSLNVSKASGPDGISNKILKECADSLCAPLARLFNMSFQLGQFPSSWKLANVVPIHKKNDRHAVNNYRPVSLLCTMSKVLERIVHTRLYDYCESNNLLTDKNSGFKKSDSTTNQLVYITHKISQALDSKEDACLVFLDLSKAFDRVWHRGLLFKLRRLGLSQIVIQWFSSYLTNRVQQVVVDGATSQPLSITAGVPQGSILGPLLFLVYINDLVDRLICNVFLFADDTFLLDIFSDPTSSSVRINTDLSTLAEWGDTWKMIFCPVKTNYMVVSNKLLPVNYPDVVFKGTVLEKIGLHKHLGLYINNKFNWNDHIDLTIVKAKRRINCINNIRHLLPRRSLCSLYRSMVLPIIEYGDVIYDNCSLMKSLDLENVQRRAALLCTGAYRHTSNDALLSELGWQPLRIRRQIHKLSLFYKMSHSLTPSYLQSIVPRAVENRYRLRSATNATLPIPYSRLSSTRNAFIHSTVKLWNTLCTETRSADSLYSFKRKIKQALYKQYNVKFIPSLYSFLPTSNSSVNLSRLRMGLSALNYHRFTYNFIADKSCPKCGAVSETIQHFLFSCPTYAAPRGVLWERLSRLLPDITQNNNTYIETLLLYGSSELSLASNLAIFSAVCKFIDATGRFYEADV